MEMKQKKNRTLQDLNFKDNFMFAAVMMDTEIAKGVLERALGIEVADVQVNYEKSIIYNPAGKGVRLDVYAKDENNTRFDVEMQVAKEHLEKRSRYYHSQIDVDILESGEDYENLPDVYVIFICDFDPFGEKKYRYTVKNIFQEDERYEYVDGRHTVFLSTVGTNENEVPKELVAFLKYAGAEAEESRKDYRDEFVSKLQESVVKVKSNQGMRERFMTWEEIKKEEYRAGHAEGKAEGKAELITILLASKFPISEELSHQIESINDVAMLDELFKAAIKAANIEEFEHCLENILSKN